jgi:hypothetical protein
LKFVPPIDTSESLIVRLTTEMTSRHGDEVIPPNDCQLVQHGRSLMICSRASLERDVIPTAFVDDRQSITRSATHLQRIGDIAEFDTPLQTSGP